jgi:CelD/BcsL family acetyltransferase involved in cellulose biosynthesis
MSAHEAIAEGKRETVKVTEPFFAARPHAGSLELACIEDTAGFRALQQDWQALQRTCPEVTPFNSWEWAFSWWQAYRHGKQLRLLTWRRDGALVAVAPLYLSSEKLGIGVQTGVLRILGDASDSDYLGFLIRTDVLPAVMQQLGGWLASDQGWQALVLRELPERSVLPPALRGIAELHGFRLRTEYGRCGVLDLPRTFEDFLRSRQPRFRTKLRSLLRKLDGSGLTFEAHCAPASLRQRLRSLFALHQSRWAHAGAPGVFGQAAKRVFYAHFVPRFARSGWLRLFSLRDGDTYLAHQLCFGTRGITYLLQEGFDVSNPSASYGQMLRAAVMRHLIEHGESQYDFLGGFSGHKEEWGARASRSMHLVIARSGWRGALYFNLPLWREQAADAAKRALPQRAVRMLKRMRGAL